MRKYAEEKLAELAAPDQALWAQGLVIAGIDEAGRGPLAGPVAAGCVVMPQSPLLLGVNDSKKLTEKKREALYDEIRETAVFCNVGLASVAEIDELNILQATLLAISRAAQGAPCDLFLVDGVWHDGLPLATPYRTVVRGDQAHYCIAAASIIAKVTRDRIMHELDTHHPAYGFAAHKGYGTAAHIQALREHGPCPEHRRLFIRNFT